MADPLDRHHLDASLEDYLPPSPPLTQETFEPKFGYPSAHSGFRSETEEMEDDRPDDSVASAGGYSPPAWRRLGNGDRSSGFWRRPQNNRTATETTVRYEFGGFTAGGRSRETSPELDVDSQMAEMMMGEMDGELDLGSVEWGDGEVGDEVLERAVRTRLPTGSLSPEKERSPEPEYKREVRRQATIPEEEEVSSFLAGQKQVDNCESLLYPLTYWAEPNTRQISASA